MYLISDRDTLQVTYINGCVKTCRLVAPESRLVACKSVKKGGAILCSVSEMSARS